MNSQARHERAVAAALDLMQGLNRTISTWESLAWGSSRVEALAAKPKAVFFARAELQAMFDDAERHGFSPR